MTVAGRTESWNHGAGRVQEWLRSQAAREAYKAYRTGAGARCTRRSGGFTVTVRAIYRKEEFTHGDEGTMTRARSRARDETSRSGGLRAVRDGILEMRKDYKRGQASQSMRIQDLQAVTMSGLQDRAGDGRDRRQSGQFRLVQESRRRVTTVHDDWKDMTSRLRLHDEFWTSQSLRMTSHDKTSRRHYGMLPPDENHDHKSTNTESFTDGRKHDRTGRTYGRTVYGGADGR